MCAHGECNRVAAVRVFMDATFAHCIMPTPSCPRIVPDFMLTNSDELDFSLCRRSPQEIGSNEIIALRGATFDGPLPTSIRKPAA